jgi:uncharacterized protein YcfL
LLKLEVNSLILKRLTVIVMALLLADCSRKPVVQVTREQLFSLEIGRFEDQVALYNLEGDLGIRGTSLAMRDGLFYIADGNGQKITRYDSYGDLLFMVYNEETNPIPLTLNPMPDKEAVTRWTFTHPLRQLGHIAVDANKRIYVEDLLPNEERLVDPETGALLDSVILFFDAEGRFQNQIGQEGINGRPFSHIEGIYTSLNDEFAVVCRVPVGWYIYWFDSGGLFRYLIKLQYDQIPIPPDRDLVFPSIDTIVVAPDARNLYLKVDYYREIFDPSTMMRTGTEPDSSVIWIMRVEDGAYESEPLEVPFYEAVENEGGRRTRLKVFYSMMGVIRNGRVFLYVPVENGYSLLALGAEGQWRGFIQVAPDEFLFNAFSLSDDGIISAMLANNWEVKLVWWRTDKFMGEASS